MEWIERVRAWAKAHGRAIKLAWLVVVLGFVAWRLARIGWGQVLDSVPANPWFYILSLGGFLVLPLSERVIFGVIWPGTPRVALAVLLRKRALNNMVVGYSGELWFFLWVRRYLKLSERHVAAGIKDSSVLSGLASTLVTAALTIAFFATGSAQVIDRVLAAHRAGLWVAAGVAAVLIPLGLRFRRTILWIDGPQALRVLVIHLLRNLVVLALQLAQWVVVLPQVGAQQWLLFLTVQALVGQIPLIPNRDLLFLAIGVELTASAGVDRAALSSVLLATTVVKQVANAATLLLTTERSRSTDR